MSKPLEKELATFEKMKVELLCEGEGKFAVIYGEELIGTFDTYDDALKIGYEKCGLNPFLVKRIQAAEPVNFFTRNFLVSCPI